MRQTPKDLEVQERARGPLSPCQVWWGSDFTCHRGGQKRWVFVCLFVRHACERQEFVCPISPWRRWSTETILMPLDRGRFVVFHPCSTFSYCRQLATPLIAEVQRNGKIWGFSPSEGDKINQWRRNFARMRTPWVCYTTPNLALISKMGRYRSPPNVKISPKLWFLATRSLHNEHI